MYIPKHFKIEDQASLFSFMEENSFATLVSYTNGAPCATHLPVTIKEKEMCIYGHFARANRQWEEIEGQNVLLIFQGPHCYISPSWYETNEAVPTWNYLSVHVYGTVTLLKKEQDILSTLELLVSQYEKPESGYRLEDVNPSYLDGASKGIVAFKFDITKMEGKAKISQNHPVGRQKRIVDELKKSSHLNENKIADLMAKNILNGETDSNT